MRFILKVLTLVVLAWPAVAAQRFEISFPKEASAAPLDGHVMLVISTPVELGEVLLLPDGWDDHPTAHYPLIVSQGHFSRGLGMAFSTEPGPGAGYKFYQDWIAGRMPRVIIMTIQHATPYFDDSYAVNSANAGPYGDAITQELIPYV